jgi:Family of unknown function (DUF5681)
MTADSLQKQIPAPDGHLFQKGRSGNPAGRQRGSHNRSTLAAEVLLEGEAEALTRRAIELALEGDTTALKLCLERIVPQRKSRAVCFDLPSIERVEDLGRAIGSVLQAASSGRLLLDEAAALVGMMESKRRIMETIDLEQRLRALESESPGQDAGRGGMA